MSTSVLVQQLRSASTLWDVVSVLLRHWQNRPSGHIVARDWIDPYSEWTRIEDAVENFFATRPNGRLMTGDTERLMDWVGTGDFDATHAVAWGIDAAAASTFTGDWRRGLSLVNHQLDLQPGDVYPVGVLLAGDIPRNHRFSTRPDAATDPPTDELPHVRIYRRPEYRPIDVNFDFRLENRLKAVFANLEELVTLHPNATSEDFVIPDGPLMFPVKLRDEAAQLGRFQELLRRACFSDFAPQLVVAPELAATDEVIAAVQLALEDASRPDCLVVAGSQHIGVGATAANRAYALLNEEEPITHDKMIPFRRSRSWRGAERKEAIVPNPKLTIFAAGRFRFALLVCKDFLDTEIQQLLGRLGVNIVAVPAMSAKTDRFASGAERMVDLSQSYAVISNGPFIWKGQEPAEPASVFAQPVYRRKVATVSPGDGRRATGFAWFEVGGDVARWNPVDLR
jgi:hypothetical protein